MHVSPTEGPTLLQSSNRLLVVLVEADENHTQEDHIGM